MIKEMITALRGVPCAGEDICTAEHWAHGRGRDSMRVGERQAPQEVEELHPQSALRRHWFWVVLKKRKDDTTYREWLGWRVGVVPFTPKKVIKVTWGQSVGPQSHRAGFLIRKGWDLRELSPHTSRGMALWGLSMKADAHKLGREPRQKRTFHTLISDFGPPEWWQSQCVFFKPPVCRIWL